MSLQALWSLFLAHPAQAVNGLALFFTAAGGWLLLATRVRELRAVSRLVASGEMEEMDEETSMQDEATQRLNRFFYGFGGATLAGALLLSWFSTTL